MELLIALSLFMIISMGNLSFNAFILDQTNVVSSKITENELRLALGEALSNPDDCKQNLFLNTDGTIKHIKSSQSIKVGIWGKNIDIVKMDLEATEKGKCMVGSTEHTGCTDKASCEKAHKSETDCTADTSGTAGTWAEDSTKQDLSVYFKRNGTGGFAVKSDKKCTAKDKEQEGCYKVSCSLKNYSLASGASNPTGCQATICRSLRTNPAEDFLKQISCQGKGKCMVGDTEHTACTDKASCEKKHKSETDCTEDSTNGTAGVWTETPYLGGFDKQTGEAICVSKSDGSGDSLDHFLDSYNRVKNPCPLRDCEKNKGTSVKQIQYDCYKQRGILISGKLDFSLYNNAYQRIQNTPIINPKNGSGLAFDNDQNPYVFHCIPLKGRSDKEINKIICGIEGGFANLDTAKNDSKKCNKSYLDKQINEQKYNFIGLKIYKKATNDDYLKRKVKCYSILCTFKASLTIKERQDFCNDNYLPSYSIKHSLPLYFKTEKDCSDNCTETCIKYTAKMSHLTMYLPYTSTYNNATRQAPSEYSQYGRCVKYYCPDY